MSNFKLLIESLVSHSNTKESDFTKLREEWELTDVLKQESWNECLCGKEIKELCYIKNKFNNNVLIVGNECIKKICPGGKFSTKTKQLFDSIRNLNKKGSLNKLLINYCRDKEILNDWEYEFCLNTHSKRKLSDKQLEKKEAINTKILSKVSKTSILDPGKIKEVKQTIPPPILKKK